MAKSRTILLVSAFVFLLLAGCGNQDGEINNVVANESLAANDVGNGNVPADANSAGAATAQPAANAIRAETSTTNWTLPAAEPHYTSREGDKYYYVSAVSEEDKKKGTAVGDVVITRYLGKIDGKQTLAWIKEDGTVESISTCSQPCKIIKEVDADGRELRLTPFSEGSIIGDAFADASNGFLRPARHSEHVIDKQSASTAQQ